MKVYLVRHGQTGGNIARRHQVETTPLSSEGVEQAKVVAEKIKTLNPTNLITSSLVRAVETASIIGQVCDLVPETNAEFIELRRPTNMYGYHHRSLRSIVFYMQWFLGKKSDGESYREIRDRFLSAQAYLSKYPNDARVVIVSHAVFINLFVAHICDARSMSPFKALKVFKKVLTMPNTDLVELMFEKEAPANTCAWSVIK